MKRFLTLFGVLALFSLTSCQKTKESVVTDNPNYDPITETVKTEFVLNVSTSAEKETKTSAEFVQENGVFLGMDAAHLLTYQLPYKSSDEDNPGYFFYSTVYNNEPVAATRDYNLGTLFPANSVTAAKASRTVELSLPLGTNAVMLYGKATKSYSSDLQGSITMDGNPKDLRTLYYSLNTRLTSQNGFDAGAFTFSHILNYFLVAGLVNELEGFWKDPTGVDDKSYAIWFPVPEAGVTLPDLATVADGETRVVDNVTYTCYKGQVSWRQMGRMYDYAHDDYPDTKSDEVAKTINGTKFEMAALCEVLGSSYSELTTIKGWQGTGSLRELRAGSAQAFLRTVQDLYAVVERCASSSPTVWEEQVAKLLAIELQTRIHHFFEITADGNLDFIRGTDGKVVLTGTSGLLATLEARCAPSEWDTYGDIVTDELSEEFFYSDHFKGFPTNIGLPHGAAILSITIGEDTSTGLQGIDSFKYVTDIPAYGFGTATFPIANYRYPAELMYFGNSPIRVTDLPKKAGDYPASVTAWNTESQWTGWTSTDASVLSSTRAVAMKNNINYGTALLASTARYGENVTVLKDNNAALHEGEEDNEIPISGGGLLVTGIIVGGQADVVGWDYTRRPDGSKYQDMKWNTGTKVFDGVTYADNKFDKMIYDVVPTPFKVGANNVIYTMVWDNYDATKSPGEQSDVYVGLELVNNTGEDFWGEMNLVRQGCTFYILGKLDLSTAIAAAQQSNPSAFTNLSPKGLNYCYPPFDPSTGATINVPRVFMQDYKTIANLILSTDALKHAYVTLPDLRSSQVSLGLAVDMNWTSGLVFDVEMGVLN